MIRVRLSILFLVLILFGCSQKPKENVAKLQLNSPAQIFQIMEESKLVYNIDIDSTVTSVFADSPTVLHNQLYIEENDSGISLLTYNLPKQLLDTLNVAEFCFQVGNYHEALQIYRYIMTKSPEYHYALTLIGDVYYIQDKFDSAEFYFKKAIQENFIDYNAHWFLADTYKKIGLKKEAANEMTIAHLLNVNHEKMKIILKSYRGDIGHPYKEWSFEPKYSLSKSDHRVDIKFQQEWMGYSLVKAVWKYEPGYAESMIGDKYEENSMHTLEEREAILSYLVTNEDKEPINRIVKDGFVDEFILYEIFSKKVPSTMLLLPNDVFMKVVDYFNKYH
jgi:tetratricopeptide (TPR) repeat protein